MLKAIKRELRGAVPMLWLALGIGWGSALVLEAVVNIITASSGFQDDGWLSIGGVVALGAVTLVFFVSGVVQFSSSFQLAITMGCTRRAYLFSALAANVVLALGAMLATWPISPLAWLAKQALFPAAPLEGGSLHSAMPALWVFEGHIWILPLIALTAVAVGGGDGRRDAALRAGRLLGGVGVQHAAGRQCGQSGGYYRFGPKRPVFPHQAVLCVHWRAVRMAVGAYLAGRCAGAGRGGVAAFAPRACKIK